MALSYSYHYSPDDSLIDYTTNNLSHIFLYFFKRKNKQNTFKTEYCPFTWFFHKLLLEYTKVAQYKITTKERTDFWGLLKCKVISSIFKNINISMRSPPLYSKAPFIILKHVYFDIIYFPGKVFKINYKM